MFRANLLPATTRTGRVVRRNALLESPMPVLAHERVVIPSRLSDRGTALAGDDEGPPRPRRRRVTVDRDHEVREEMVILRDVRLGAHVFFHERLDVRRSRYRSEAANPLAVLREQRRVAREVAAVEIAPVVEQEVLDLLLVLEPLQTSRE